MDCQLKRKRDIDIKDVSQLPQKILNISSGKYGEVYLGLDEKIDSVFAIKKIKKKSLPRDYEIPKKLDHPNIIKVFNLFEDKHFHYISMEYYPDGDLINYINKNIVTIDNYYHIAKQLILAVKYLHSHNIYHLDIKLDNILVMINQNIPSITLCDFGTSIVGNEPIYTFSGTRGYLSPEVLLKFSHSGDKRDVWAIGVCLYTLYKHKYPFGKKGDDTTVIDDLVINREIFSNIHVKNMTKPNTEEYDKRLIKLLLTKDPNDRPFIHEIEPHFHVDNFDPE